MKLARDGKDPLLEKKRAEQESICNPPKKRDQF